MESKPFKLLLTDDGKEEVEIPRALLKYFGLFQTAHGDGGFEIFVRDAKFPLDKQLWEFIISVYVKHDDLYSDDEPLKKAIDDDNVDKTLAFFDIKMLYTLIRTFDYYDMPLFLMAIIRQVMRRLLCMTTEQLYLTHHEMKRTIDESCTTTVIDLIVGDCTRRSVILEILKTYIDISGIVDFMCDRFVPHQNHTLAIGKDYSLVLTRRGVFSCGNNEHGQIARPAMADNMKFQRVALENVISIKTGYNTSFFLTKCGSLYSAGHNEKNRLGRVTTGESSHTPEKVPLDFVLTMDVSSNHAIALTADGVYTWGENSAGQLGNGTRIPQAVPTRLAIDATIVDIGINTFYSAMLSESGDFYICGLRSYMLPTKIELSGPVKRMVCHAFHVILIMRDESIYVWSDTTKLYASGKKKLAPIVLATPIRINTERIFDGSNDQFYALDDNGDLYSFDVSVEDDETEPNLIIQNAMDVIDVIGNGSHTLILKKDGLYGIGSYYPLGLYVDAGGNRQKTLTPIKLPLVIGHEEFADTLPSSDANKKRKMGNNCLSCHKCGSGDPTSLHLHSTSKKLFCGSSCLRAYRNPTF